MTPRVSSCMAFACAAAVLFGCARQEQPVTPPPLAAARAPAAPDTTTMGAAPSGSCSAQAGEALQRINSARAAGRRCGARTMAAANPLAWDAQLYTAAFGHSTDMARRNYFEHQSPGGSTVAERASAARYKWRSLGENIAGGNQNVGDAVQAWLGSPEHCENLMDPKFADVAVACVVQPGTEFGTYWTMVLGRR
jgi:uncharacterized protein YkwD